MYSGGLFLSRVFFCWTSAFYIQPARVNPAELCRSRLTHSPSPRQLSWSLCPQSVWSSSLPVHRDCFFLSWRIKAVDSCRCVVLAPDLKLWGALVVDTSAGSAVSLFNVPCSFVSQRALRRSSFCRFGRCTGAKVPLCRPKRPPVRELGRESGRDLHALCCIALRR